MDGGAWWAAVHGVTKSWTRLSDFTFPFHFHALEKETATHSSVLTWRIPGTGEPGGLPSLGSHRVGHDWSDLAAVIQKHVLWISQKSKWEKWKTWHSLCFLPNIMTCHLSSLKNGPWKKRKTGFKLKFYIYCFTPLANHDLFQIAFAFLEKCILSFSLFKWN